MIGQDEITEESENVQENDQNSQELSERTTYAIVNQKAAKLLEHAGDGPLGKIVVYCILLFLVSCFLLFKFLLSIR